jgi:ribonuclease HI
MAKLVLQWIPTNCGIPVNEEADELAKVEGFDEAWVSNWEKLSDDLWVST